jgi:plasmid stability protein
MLLACYCHAVGNLQVKHLPDDVHDALRARAREEGISLSELVSRVLKREVAKPSLSAWLADLDRQPILDKDLNTVAVLDELRGPWPGDAGR